MTSINRSTGMSPSQARHGRPPRTAAMAVSGLVPPLGTLEQWRRVVTATNTTLELRDAALSLSQREKHAVKLRNSRPAPTFRVGENVYKYHAQFTKLTGPWRKGFVVTGLDSSPDFYLVSTRNADGSLHYERRVPVSMLAKLNTSRYTDGGLDKLIAADRMLVHSIVGHSISHPDNIVSFKVRWANKGEDEDSFADARDLLRDCKAMLKAYCKSSKIAYRRIVRQCKLAGDAPDQVSGGATAAATPTSRS